MSRCEWCAGADEDTRFEADRASRWNLNLPQEAVEKLGKEIEARMPGNSQEAAVIRTYLDTCLSLP